ncbi:hypothetical protein FLA_0721 [Filimonas lacunae]|nr:hypothetical protein FLA_0721 [Filimonas lacunae]
MPATRTAAWNPALVSHSEYLEWDAGSLYVQGAEYNNQAVLFYELKTITVQQVYFKTPVEPLVALWFVVSGKSAFTLEGLGAGEIEADQCVLSYLPPKMEHFARYEQGDHAFMCISLQPFHIEQLCAQLPQMHYFLEHVRNGISQTWQQPFVAVDADMRELLYEIVKAGSASIVSDNTQVLLHNYSAAICKSMQHLSLDSKHMALAMEIKLFIDKAQRPDLSIDDIARRFNTSDYSVKHSFKLLTGQTIGAYIKEQKLLFLRELVMDKDKCFKACAAEAGFHVDRASKEFKDRFGMTQKEMRMRSERW